MPPPPPPPGPPPPPAFKQQNIKSTPAPSLGGGSGDGRNLLLDSIRQGKTLKKTVVNDRSAPLVSASGKFTIHLFVSCTTF